MALLDGGMRVVTVVATAYALGGCTRPALPAPDGDAEGCALPPRASTAPAPSSSGDAAQTAERPGPRSVLGAPLESCGTSPMTGWFRDGACRTDEADRGSHTVCAEMTDEFLRFTVARGNDLVTPRGSFPGLRPGDRWCLCDGRFAEADEAGVAPPIVLRATNQAALRRVARERLEARAAQ